MVVTSGLGVSCNTNGIHTANSFWRSFNMATYVGALSFQVDSVKFGIEIANTGTAATMPIIIRLYTQTGTLALANLTLISTTNINIASQTLSVVNVPVSVGVPANATLVMEVHVPAGTATNGQFYPGANTAGATGPSYISATACAINDITNYTAVGTGFPNCHLVMSVIGRPSCIGTPNAGTTISSANSVVCGNTANLSLNGNTAASGISYQWQYNTNGSWVNFGTNAATQTSPAITQTTQFRCRVTCNNGGTFTANATPVTVDIVPPVVNLGGDTTICPNVTHTFNAGHPGSAYLWTTGATSQTIAATTAGSYGVQVTLPNGCVGTDNIVVTNGIVPVAMLPAITNLCDGETASLNAGNTGSTFSWSPDNQVTQVINVTDGGNYAVTMKSTDGCIVNNTTEVIIRPLPVVSLGDDTSICDGATIVLDAGNPGNTYSWSNGLNTQQINASDSGTYNLVITTPYGCVLEQDQHIAYLPSARTEGFNFIPQFHEEMGKVSFSPLNPTNVNAYEWDFGDNTPTSVAVNPIHVYTASGDYLVKLKVFNDCGSNTFSLVIHVDIATGLVTLAEDQAQVVLYPNPSRDVINIHNKSLEVKMEEVMVFNTLGAVVYRQAIHKDEKHTFSIANLATGIYSVRILTDKGFVVKRFEVLR